MCCVNTNQRHPSPLLSASTLLPLHPSRWVLFVCLLWLCHVSVLIDDSPPNLGVSLPLAVQSSPSVGPSGGKAKRMSAQGNANGTPFSYTWGIADNNIRTESVVEFSPNVNYTVSDGSVSPFSSTNSIHSFIKWSILLFFCETPSYCDARNLYQSCVGHFHFYKLQWPAQHNLFWFRSCSGRPPASHYTNQSSVQGIDGCVLGFAGTTLFAPPRHGDGGGSKTHITRRRRRRWLGEREQVYAAYMCNWCCLPLRIEVGVENAPHQHKIMWHIDRDKQQHLGQKHTEEEDEWFYAVLPLSLSLQNNLKAILLSPSWDHCTHNNMLYNTSAKSNITVSSSSTCILDILLARFLALVLFVVYASGGSQPASMA